METVQTATNNEIEFLRNLGTHKESREKLSVDSIPPIERLKLTQMYQRGISFRHNWGTIDPVVVRAEVDNLIVHLQLQIQALSRAVF